VLNLAASPFFITVKISETITATKLAQQGTHENSFSQQNVVQQNSKQKMLALLLRVCDWFTDFSLISDTSTQCI
jgi:hypothetical protein